MLDGYTFPKRGYFEGMFEAGSPVLYFSVTSILNQAAGFCQVLYAQASANSKSETGVLRLDVLSWVLPNKSCLRWAPRYALSF